MNKSIRAVYLKILGIDMAGKDLCNFDWCSGVNCYGFKFTIEDVFMAEQIERKYGAE